MTIWDISEGKYEDKVVFIKTALSMHSICVNSFSVKDTVVKQYDYYKLLVEKTFSNTFLILNEDNNILRHTLHFLSSKNNINRIIIYNKFHHSLISLLDLYSDSYLRSIGIFEEINPKTDIITMYSEDPIRFSKQCFQDWVVIFRHVIKKFCNSLKEQYSDNDYRNIDISFIRQILLPYNKVAHNRDVYVMIYVGHMRKIRTTFEYKLIHLSGIWVFDKKTWLRCLEDHFVVKTALRVHILHTFQVNFVVYVFDVIQTMLSLPLANINANNVVKELLPIIIKLSAYPFSISFIQLIWPTKCWL